MFSKGHRILRFLYVTFGASKPADPHGLKAALAPTATKTTLHPNALKKIALLPKQETRLIRVDRTNAKHSLF
jgi:hypothetical protein